MSGRASTHLSPSFDTAVQHGNEAGHLRSLLILGENQETVMWPPFTLTWGFTAQQSSGVGTPTFAQALIMASALRRRSDQNKRPTCRNSTVYLLRFHTRGDQPPITNIPCPPLPPSRFKWVKLNNTNSLQQFVERRNVHCVLRMVNFL